MAYGYYPLALKKSMVSRFLEDPENKIGAFSKENGIPETNLRDWIRQAESGILDSMKKPKHFKYWTLEEKLSSILEFEQLSEEEKGKWLRQHALKLERINLWKEELFSTLKNLNDKNNKKFENKKIKELEKEIARKDKALAEASALLFAKKKLDSIFGENIEEK